MEINKKVYLGIVVMVLLVGSFAYFRRSSTEEVKLYFSDEEAQYLVPEIREVRKRDLYINIIRELINGPTNEGLGVTIPPEASLIKAELEGALITLDFTQKLRDEHWGGSAGEIITIYSIVNTLTALDEIEEVKILISSREVQTLAGHLELGSPLKFNPTLVNGE